MVSGNLVLLIIVAVVVGYVVFFMLPIPSGLRTILAIIAAIFLFIWLLSLMGFIAL